MGVSPYVCVCVCECTEIKRFFPTADLYEPNNFEHSDVEQWLEYRDRSTHKKHTYTGQKMRQRSAKSAERTENTNNNNFSLSHRASCQTIGIELAYGIGNGHFFHQLHIYCVDVFVCALHAPFLLIFSYPAIKWFSCTFFHLCVLFFAFCLSPWFARGFLPTRSLVVEHYLCAVIAATARRSLFNIQSVPCIAMAFFFVHRFIRIY